MKRSAVGASGVAFALVLSVFAQSAGAGQRSEPFEFRQFSQHRGGVVSGRALALALGDVQLTIGQNQGSFSQSIVQQDSVHAVLDDSFVIDCSSDAAAQSQAVKLRDEARGITFAGSVPCLSQDGLRAKGVNLADGQREIGIQALEKAGVVKTEATPDKRVDTNAAATSAGALVSNIAHGQATCNNDRTADSATGLRIAPNDALGGFLTLAAGYGRCTIVPAADGARLSQDAGVADLALTLTQTIMNSAAGQTVNQTLDTIQNQIAALPPAVSAPVNNTINNLQQNLTSTPVLRLQLGPQVTSILASAEQVVSTSESKGVVLTILGGLATVELGTAKAVATANRTAPSLATADPAIIRVKVLNLTLADPTSGAPLVDLAVDPRFLHDTLKTVPVIQGVVRATDTEIVLLEGTPLETRISFATGTTCADQTKFATIADRALPAGQAAAAGQCTLDQAFRYDATATASAVAIRSLASPLPTVALRLADAQAAAFVGGQDVNAVKAVAIGGLARTGALPFDTAVVGFGLIGIAAAIRRRVRR